MTMAIMIADLIMTIITEVGLDMANLPVNTIKVMAATAVTMVNMAIDNRDTTEITTIHLHMTGLMMAMIITATLIPIDRLIMYSMEGKRIEEVKTMIAITSMIRIIKISNTKCNNHLIPPLHNPTIIITNPRVMTLQGQLLKVKRIIYIGSDTLESKRLKNKLFVGRMRNDTTVATMRNYFERFGELIDAYIPKGNMKNDLRS